MTLQTRRLGALEAARGMNREWTDDDEERDALQRAEVDALTRLLAERPLHDALRAWVNEPDERGWPALGYAMDYDAFMGRVQRERGTMAVHRNGTGSGDYGREWRRRYPDWRPDMTPDDYDRWELELITKQEGQTP